MLDHLEAIVNPFADYVANLQDDWQAFVAEVADLYDTNPDLTLRDVARITGADVEDVRKALMGA